MRLAILLCGLMGCGHKPAPERGVYWTEADGTPVQDGVRQRKPSTRGSPDVAQEPNVPRLRCNDGTLSVNCSAHARAGDCCANQGGVFHDQWGNVVYE